MTGKFKQIIALSLGLLLILTGCTTKAQPGNSEQKAIAEDFTQRISSEISLPDLINHNEDYFNALFEDSYGLVLEEIEDYVIMEPAMSLGAWVITMYRMKDPTKTQEGLEAAKGRAEKLASSFENYIPGQYEIAKNYIAIENNGYILLSIGEESEKVKDIFLELTK